MVGRTGAVTRLPCSAVFVGGTTVSMHAHHAAHRA